MHEARFVLDDGSEKVITNGNVDDVDDWDLKEALEEAS